MHHADNIAVVFHEDVRNAPGESPVRRAIQAYTTAASKAVPAIGPSAMTVVLKYLLPVCGGMRECVGNSPTTPQQDAGTRMDPPESLPNANGTTPAATIPALPEPQATRYLEHVYFTLRYARETDIQHIIKKY